VKRVQARSGAGDEVDIKQENIAYWNQRAKSYSLINQEQLQNGRGMAWLAAIEEPLTATFPERKRVTLRILDIGCGPGLFSILLARRGYRAVATDYTPNMLDEARTNAQATGTENLIEFVEADAQNLPFADCSFDAIVSRNLTWDLPRPCDAYDEWHRVLVPGGIIVNFDANWYNYLFDDEARHAYENDRLLTQESGMREECEIPGFERMEEIAREMPLSPLNRPAWDEAYLRKLGMDVDVDADIWQRVWNDEEKVNFASTPQFRIVARKQ
jgi:ubiquinone/menaquinone biosynthesis C-methylase UbiE